MKLSNPEIIKIHIAFACILSLSSAINYLDKVEWSDKQLRGLSTDSTSDLELLFIVQLVY